MNAKTDNGRLAEKILDEYMRNFQQRNLNMRVFSAHLHMDEATPHLHIDFVPFITGSKRGLDTRVTLKQALAVQGFTGGSRKETEWNQWVLSEKKTLSMVMERHGIEWEHKGTHKKHLSVFDYEKKMRSAEVSELETKIEGLQGDADKAEKSADKIQSWLKKLSERKDFVNLKMDQFVYEPEWQLPEPSMITTAKNYKLKFATPLVNKLKELIKSLLIRYYKMEDMVENLKSKLSRANTGIDNLNNKIQELKNDNAKLTEDVMDYKRIRKIIGEDRADAIILQATTEENGWRR